MKKGFKMTERQGVALTCSIFVVSITKIIVCPHPGSYFRAIICIHLLALWCSEYNACGRRDFLNGQIHEGLVTARSKLRRFLAE